MYILSKIRIHLKSGFIIGLALSLQYCLHDYQNERTFIQVRVLWILETEDGWFTVTRVELSVL